MIQGTVQCPAEYFRKMAFVDYTDWRSALPREFFQNSIDARSKNIHVTFGLDNNIVTIQDDGIGMNLDVIQNKLLVLGGSAKETGSVGAFGKAKELLYFSWPNWSIETRNLIVIGQGPDYIIDKVDNPIKGTISKVTIDTDGFYRVMAAFSDVAGKMDTKTKIFIDGNLIRPTSRRGRLIKSFDFGDLYLNKSVNSAYMEVKVAGIWMYSHYLGSSCGQLILELSKSSIDCMTSNRDDLKWEYRSVLMEFARELIANEKTATTPKPQMIQKVIQGEGKVRIRPEMIDSLLNRGLNIGEARLSLMDQASSLGHNLALLKARLGNETYIDRERWSFIGYKPDFELMYTKKQTGAVKRFMKTKKALVLAKIWTEIVKQTILDNSKDYMEFTAGFTFDEDTSASIVKNGVNYTIYLNPILIGKQGGWDKKVLSERFLLAEELRDKAIHETAHMLYSDHNENFVCAMHSIRAKTALSFKIYEKIGRMK